MKNIPELKNKITRADLDNAERLGKGRDLIALMRFFKSTGVFGATKFNDTDIARLMYDPKDFTDDQAYVRYRELLDRNKRFPLIGKEVDFLKLCLHEIAGDNANNVSDDALLNDSVLEILHQCHSDNEFELWSEGPELSAFKRLASVCPPLELTYKDASRMAHRALMGDEAEGEKLEPFEIAPENCFPDDEFFLEIDRDLGERHAPLVITYAETPHRAKNSEKNIYGRVLPHVVIHDYHDRSTCWRVTRDQAYKPLKIPATKGDFGIVVIRGLSASLKHLFGEGADTGALDEKAFSNFNKYLASRLSTNEWPSVGIWTYRVGF